MDLKEIKILVDKFYAGETSPAEEKGLRKYFQENDVPFDLQADKEVFLSMTQLSEQEKPTADFSKGLEDLIDNQFSEEKVVFLNPKTKWFVGIAASILILVSVFVTSNLNGNTWKQDTYSDPEMAYEETLKVLNFVSATMNRNTKKLGYINSINKSMRPVDTRYLKKEENENKKYDKINPDNDLFYNYIAAKWPGVAGR